MIHLSKIIIVSLYSISLMICCREQSNPPRYPGDPERGYPADHYNLIRTLELPDIEYINRIGKLLDDRAFDEGKKWAKKEKKVQSISRVEEKAIELFTKHYGTPEEMSEGDDDFLYIYKSMRQTYIKWFTKGCKKVWLDE